MTMVDTNAKVKVDKKREASATHELLDQNGDVIGDDVESAQEVAQGYRYTLIANKDVWEWFVAQATQDEIRMLALFGVRTLATNETSAVRNDPKGGGSPEEQMDALRARFGDLRSGKWLDRTREGGPRIDKPNLAGAIVDVLINSKKVDEHNRAATLADKLQKLEEDSEYMKKVRQVPEVAAAYAARMGRVTMTIDQL
jgi:hypothetical protein